MQESDCSYVPAKIIPENGETFSGYCSPLNQGPVSGEIVFTTGMTGYPETLTDPSYCDQIICFTYPLIGNYGVPNKKFWESERIYAKGVVVCEVGDSLHHYEAEQSLLSWLRSQNVPLMRGVDTRALTKVLRKEGTMRGVITTSEDPYTYPALHSTHPVSRVSIKEPKIYKNPAAKKIIYAIDCGMKENIIRALSTFPIEIRRVPHDFDFTDKEFDGVFISNGPGDPREASQTIEIIRKLLLKEKPIFGICLGIQILSLAAGGNTYKLPFGHRGHNQPCLDTVSQKCYITSQNHGYAVEAESLPDDWTVTFRNLNDHSVAGIAHNTKPFFAVQFHPEAGPGPTDTQWLFEKFYQML